VNLKKLLMEMGNKLVVEHRFSPSVEHKGMIAEDKEHFTRSTLPIGLLTEAINQSPEMRAVLAEMGVDWPMPG